MTSLIRNLNPNMASGFDGMSGEKLFSCHNLVVLPLKIISQNILITFECGSLQM